MDQFPVHLQQAFEQVAWFAGDFHDNLLQDQNRFFAVYHQVLDTILCVIQHHYLFRRILTHNRYLHLKQILLDEIKLFRHTNLLFSESVNPIQAGSLQ